MITVWDAPNPFALITPFGTLDLNTVLGDGDVYLLINDGCSVDRPLRVTVDQIPQGDGSILHRRFTDGYSVTLKIEPWKTVDGTLNRESLFPACDADLVRMVDTLMLHVNAMLNAQDARLFWTPPGADGRLLINLRWRTFPGQQVVDNAGFAVTATFDTPFPYEISALQTTPALGGTVTNNGNTDFFPVLHIDGPSTAFLVSNGSQGIVYDSARPGGVPLGSGDYAEIDCFRNTIVLNGNVQDLDAGVDPLLSTFFSFPPGSVGTSISGATGFVLMNDAWA